jgi:hypothetical protein
MQSAFNMWGVSSWLAALMDSPPYYSKPNQGKWEHQRAGNTRKQPRKDFEKNRHNRRRISSISRKANR